MTFPSSRARRSLRAWAVGLACGACIAVGSFGSPARALEFEPDNDRANPPASGYWYSDIPGSYNPWTDGSQMTLLEFPAANEGVTSYGDIQMLPAGYSTRYSDGPVAFDDGGSWEFLDLSTLSGSLSGTNWIHGAGYEYPTDSWALVFNGEGGFDTFRPGDDAFDLRAYRGIAIEVSNLGDTYLVFSMYSRGMRQWLGQKHGAVIGLEPGDTDIMYFPFRRDESQPPPGTTDYFRCIHHLCGYPGGHLYGLVNSQAGSVSGVMGIQARVPDYLPAGDVRWSINRVWAGGRYEVPTMERIRASGHTESQYADDAWTDEYGQYLYDDWVGKLWNTDDAAEQYRILSDYVTANPGPSTWDEYGGWAAADAPQLEATGWFRVENYNGRWWFVDPNGRLFLSQGALHMSANMPRPAADAGYDQDRYTEEVYFRRLRSMGINSIGGNSSWKWHEGRFPYFYQVRTGLAPIDYTDIEGIGTVAEFEDWMYRYLSDNARRYIRDPYCIGVIVDNELNISEAGNTFPEPVSKIYFRAIRHALDRIAIEEGRPDDPTRDPDADGTHPERSPIIMVDPASNGGQWMGHYCDVMAQHRMEGYVPNFHKTEWGKPIGQFAFTMGNLDVGVAHYGLTMFLNQRNRAQGMTNFMARAYANPQNIAVHSYAYMKTTNRSLTEFRFLVNKSDTTDYFLAEYLRAMGDDMYRIHMGWQVEGHRRPRVPAPAEDRVRAANVGGDHSTAGLDGGAGSIDGGPGSGHGSAGGCGCRVDRRASSSGAAVVGVFALIALRRRRRATRKPAGRH